MEEENILWDKQLKLKKVREQRETEVHSLFSFEPSAYL